MNLPGFEEPGWPDDAVEVGRIVDAWGLEGGIKVQPFSADPQALFSSRRWFVQTEAGRQLLKITRAREHGDSIVASAQDLPDRNAAEALKGARIFVSRASFPTTQPDEYYWVDLVGLAVVNRSGEPLGSVTELFDNGAHSVLRVQPPDGGAERLIPFVAAYVDDVDLPARRITVDWGLDY